jgi:patatin-like phospholipase/acyl hydrolase
VKKYASFLERIDEKRPKRMLALDGGGIRGLITIEILGRLEALLRDAYGDQDLVLADYFDYVGGTSTGAIIATGIARGMSVDKIRNFYLQGGRVMLKPAPFFTRFLYHRNVATGLTAALKAELGETTLLGDPAMRTLLLLVMRNVDTDSTWPLSNNPRALFNQGTAEDGNNLLVPLWQLVRASTAAPTYFPPEELHIGKNDFIFVDGAVSVYNNPAFLLYLMATLAPYRLGWERGEDQLLLVSVGTGMSAHETKGLKPSQMTMLYNATRIPSALMYAANVEADKLCRIFGRCLFGAALDAEIGHLLEPLDQSPARPKDFTYVRYDPSLTREGLDELKLTGIQPEEVLPLTSGANLDKLQAVGQAYARNVSLSHFGLLDPTRAPA